MRMYHHRHVRGRAMSVGDLVLRRVQSNKDSYKLSPTWEGPFHMMEKRRPGVFRLTDKDGMHVPNV